MNLDELTQKGQIGKAVFIGSFITSLVICIAVEVICFFFKVDIAMSSNFQLKFAIGAVLNYCLFMYIYTKKKRYEYIISSQYKPFKLSTRLGITIIFLLLFASLIGSIGMPVAISALLKK